MMNKRRIIRRIENVDKTYYQLEEILKLNKIGYEGMLISLDTKIAYLWETIREITPQPIRA